MRWCYGSIDSKELETKKSLLGEIREKEREAVEIATTFASKHTAEAAGLAFFLPGYALKSHSLCWGAVAAVSTIKLWGCAKRREAKHLKKKADALELEIGKTEKPPIH